MDLFDYMREKHRNRNLPGIQNASADVGRSSGTAAYYRKDKLLYRAIKADKLGSIIFYGPPGTGKTTLAR